MRRHLAAAALVVLCLQASAGCAGQSVGPRGNWLGGFWFQQHWVRLAVRLADTGRVPAGTANVTFSSYEGANGVELTAVTSDGTRLRFEVALGRGAAAFDGMVSGDTIKGSYRYAGSTGEFGLTRTAALGPAQMAGVYGLYSLSPGSLIAVGQDFDGPASLRYVEFDTGRSGALWPASENSFFGGSGLRVTYPASLRVEFVRDSGGSATKLLWRQAGEPAREAPKVGLKEERLTWRSGDVTLGGTLITPPTQGPHPAIIIVPGDFGSSRDFLRLFAYNFLRRGVAALIFDSRGAGDSTGPVNSSSFQELSDDVLAGVRLLKSRGDINPGQIGLFGFSNSAWTTALAASRSGGDVAFLINQSMSGVQPWRQETFRAGAMLRAEGFPEEVVGEAVRFMELKFDAARTGQGWDRVQGVRERSGGERWFPFTNPPRSLERLRQLWQASMTYDPVPSFEKITCPVLVVWGGNDVYVPARESMLIFERAMKKAGNRDYTIKLMPTGSHSIFDAKTGGTTESSELKGFVPAYMNLLADWLDRRVGAKKMTGK